MSKQFMVLRFPDEQQAEYAFVLTLYMPDGIRNLACDDIHLDEQRNCYVAVVQDDDEESETAVAVFPAEMPFFLAAQVAYDRRSELDLAEEALEQHQASQLMKERAHAMIKDAKKRQDDSNEKGYL